MNLIRTFTIAILALVHLPLIAAGFFILAGINSVFSAEPAKPVPKLTEPAKSSGFYTDAGLSLRTTDFSHGDYSYFTRIGYQVSPHWGFDVGASHQGLDASGPAVQDIGGRLVARMPFEFLSPYTFLGATFGVKDDIWRLQPGAGIEFGVNKRLKGLSVFAEGGLDATLNGRNGYVFGAGVRLRF
jgi:hypothetical protein